MAAKNKKHKKNSEKLPIFPIILSVLLVGVIVFGILYLTKQSDDDNNNANDPDINTAIYYDDSSKKDENTNKDNSAAYDQKDAYDASTKTNEVEHTDDGKKVATPLINIAQNDKIVVISARINNFVEEGGKCTYILNKGSETKSFVKEVLPDPKATVCEALTVEKNSISSGQWSVRIEYKSNTAEGQSETQNFTN